MVVAAGIVVAAPVVTSTFISFVVDTLINFVVGILDSFEVLFVGTITEASVVNEWKNGFVCWTVGAQPFPFTQKKTIQKN